MKMMQKIHSLLLISSMLALMAILAGCQGSDQTDERAESRAPVNHPAEDPAARQQSDRDHAMTEHAMGDQSMRDEDTRHDSMMGRTARDQTAEVSGPLEHVEDFDRFTMRANVGRADVLSDAMARQYDIEPEAGLFLLNLVILENRSDRQPVPVSAQVSVRREGLSGHGESIDMRAIEVNGHLSYIGTLAASAERFFELVIEAQPEGTDEPLRMDFEVRLDAFEG